MHKSLYTMLLSLLVVGITAACQTSSGQEASAERHVFPIRGISVEAPPQKVEAETFEPMQALHANWVSIIPFGFSRGNTPTVHFNTKQWWGERLDGAAMQIQYAHAKGFKVLLKPHVWIGGQGWPGDYNLESEEDWKAWESSYSEYILASARIAEENQAEMFCVGTEYRIAARERPAFWRKLIEEVRAVYSGPLTYAANWDNYQKVSFWDALDYIGVDAYFPVCDLQTPQVETVKAGWQPWAHELSTFAKQYDRQIIFTEYGYRSIDYTAAGHWNVEDKSKEVNLDGQVNAYEGMFQALEQEDWFAGGFLWKWHISGYRNGGLEDDRFTPQNKPVEKVIAKWYGAK